MTAVINYLTRIRLGQGAISELAAELDALAVEKPLIVTDKGLVENGVLDKLRAASGLDKRTPVFDGTPENPTETAVEDARRALVEKGCDGLVAIGGGSSIDLAKGAALLASHPGPLRQYAAIEGGTPKISANTTPLVAVPTTAGTGSEVGRGALITMCDKRKLGFLSPHIIPAVAICDPEATRSLPPGLTAATGMDAVAHCVETLLSPKDNPVAEAIAIDGLQRAARTIRTVVNDGANMAARREMMIAALHGALAFQKGLGGVHSMSHALGGLSETSLHHGTLNAVLLPVVLRFNEPEVGDKYARIRQAMGLDANQRLDRVFEQLNRDLGLPETLRAMGVADSLLDTAAQYAYEDHSTATNPRAVQTADFRQMLGEAMG